MKSHIWLESGRNVENIIPTLQIPAKLPPNGSLQLYLSFLHEVSEIWLHKLHSRFYADICKGFCLFYMDIIPGLENLQSWLKLNMNQCKSCQVSLWRIQTKHIKKHIQAMRALEKSHNKSDLWPSKQILIQLRTSIKAKSIEHV